MSNQHLRLNHNEREILAIARKLNLAKGLIERGGRPSIVMVVCGISKASTLKLYKEIHGHGPCAGLLPYDPDWVVKNPTNCLHASIYVNIYKRLCEYMSADKGDIYLSSYILYEETLSNGEDKVLSINRAWHLGQQCQMSTICVKSCPKCKSFFATVTEFPDPYKMCPLCDIQMDSSGKKKWKKLNLFGRKSKNQ